MRAIPKPAILAGALALWGCTGQSPSTTQAVVNGTAQLAAGVGVSLSQSGMTPAQLATAQQVCAAASAPLAQLQSSTDAVVADTAVYPAAYCQALAALPAGQVPATTDGQTLAWLQTAVQLAGIILPAVL